MDICERMVPESEYEMLKKANEGLMKGNETIMHDYEHLLNSTKLLKNAYECLEEVNKGLQSQVDFLKKELEFEKDWSRGLNKQRRAREAAVDKFIRDIEDFTADSKALEDIVSAFNEKYYGIHQIDL